MNCSILRFACIKSFQRRCKTKKAQLLFVQRYAHHDVRVRFAPSPTGFLHIGGLRTALYNYLFAKSYPNGKFILRIEDTDQSRIVSGAVDNLISTLEWVGLTPDESPKHGGEYGPYVQSERLQHYKSFAEELVSNGSGYRCFCSPQRLYLLKKDQQQRQESPRYDNCCRYLSTDEIENNLKQNKPHVIRLKLPMITHEISDVVFGLVSFNMSLEGDPVLLKSDGFPTYHLANVVDDYMMKITHVIRGKEWLASTPKHIFIYKAFGWVPPVFMHLPLLINSDGSKVSKRQGDVYVEQYKEKGFSPASIINFMAYYGSGFPEITFPLHTSDHNVLIQKLVSKFDHKKLVLSNAIVDFTKLQQFSSALTCHLVESSETKIRQQLVHHLFDLVLQHYGNKSLFCIDPTFSSDAVRNYLNTVLEMRKTHIVKINDLITEDYDYLWIRPQHYEKNSILQVVVEDVIRFLSDFSWNPFNAEEAGKKLIDIGRLHDVKFPMMMKFLRTMLSGKPQGPKIVDMLMMLGKKETLHRLKFAL